MESGQNRRLMNSDLGGEASVCLYPCPVPGLSLLAGLELQEAESKFHRNGLIKSGSKKGVMPSQAKL